MGFRKPDDKFITIAAEVIEQIGVMSPSFERTIPTADDRLDAFVWQWGRLMEELDNYPDFVFYDAVDFLFRSEDGNNFTITTGNYLRAVYLAAEKAESVPWKRKEMEKKREERREAWDRFLNSEYDG